MSPPSSLIKTEIKKIADESFGLKFTPCSRVSIISTSPDVTKAYTTIDNIINFLRKIISKPLTGIIPAWFYPCRTLLT